MICLEQEESPTQGLGSHMVSFPHQVPSQGCNGDQAGVSNSSFPTFHSMTIQLTSKSPGSLFAKEK